MICTHDIMRVLFSSLLFGIMNQLPTKNKTKLPLLFVLLTLTPGLLASSSIDVADSIEKKFDSNMFKMKAIHQSHYAVRMYRLSGNKDYLQPIINFQFIESIQLSNLLNQIKTTPLYFNAKRVFWPKNYTDLPKEKKRQLLLEQSPGIENYLRVLQILDHAHQLNLLYSQLYPHSTEAIKLITDALPALRAFLLNPEGIKIASAQFVNYVYLLKRLGLLDIEKEYLQAFQNVFMNIGDEIDTDEPFTDKIYGMTHIILSESAYYQQEVSYEKLKWIYAYFDAHIDAILARTKTDVIAEVGICYFLADKTADESIINKIKLYMIKEFDPVSQQMPSYEGKNDIDRSEHRNVLSLMFLRWSKKLYPGPDLSNSKELLTTFLPGQAL
jgi:hypothetical protein